MVMLLGYCQTSISLKILRINLCYFLMSLSENLVSLGKCSIKKLYIWVDSE